uniref:Uncharacterized protein n=1 Tax=Anopheles coluzzii TaxID=1518534 RepID=A0A8W7PYL6_ANOCL
MVQVALAIVRRDHAAELAVAGIVEAGVGREQQQPAGLLPPADLLPAHDRLHDRVEATLRRVQIAGHVRALHLLLVTTKIRPNTAKTPSQAHFKEQSGFNFLDSNRVKE